MGCVFLNKPQRMNHFFCMVQYLRAIYITSYGLIMLSNLSSQFNLVHLHLKCLNTHLCLMHTDRFLSACDKNAKLWIYKYVRMYASLNFY